MPATKTSKKAAATASPVPPKKGGKKDDQLELGCTMDVQCDAYVPHGDIEPDPANPRTDADDELRASIKARGIQEPLIARPHPEKNNKWMIVNGERRWRGSAGVQAEIPINIRYDLERRGDRLLIQMTTNAHRPMNALDEAKAFRDIMADKGWSQNKLAEELGVPRSTIGDRVRLLELPPVWLAMIENGAVLPSSAPAIHRLVKDATPDMHVSAAGVVALMVGDRDGEPLELKAFEAAIAGHFAPPVTSRAPVSGSGTASSLHDRDVDDDGADDEQVSPVLDPEIAKAHALAQQIEASSDKKAKALRATLHAMPFWENFRYARSGAPDHSPRSPEAFWALVTYMGEHTRVGAMGWESAKAVALADEYGFPVITAEIWRNAPVWFAAASSAQSTAIHEFETMAGFRLRVEAGDLLGSAWGDTHEDQLEQIRKNVAAARRRMIDALVTWGLKANRAEGEVDRYIARIAESAQLNAVRQAERVRQADDKARHDEALKPEREKAKLREEAEGLTDTRLLDAIVQHRLSIDVDDGGWVHVGSSDGSTAKSGDIRIVLRGAIARAVPAVVGDDAPIDDGECAVCSGSGHNPAVDGELCRECGGTGRTDDVGGEGEDLVGAAAESGSGHADEDDEDDEA
jgi:ParB/RepB/Spo0J family partition protein